MSTPTEYHDSVTPEPYESALMPADLSLEDYEVLEQEQGTAEERYEEAVTQHDERKAMKAKEAKEACTEKLRKEKEVRLLKVETLKKEKLEAERRAEEKRQEEEWLWLEVEAKERALALEKEKKEAAERQRLPDLKEQEEKEKEKEKEKEDEANELALLAAGAPLASDGNSELDPVDPKTAAMAELKRRRKIAQGKKREHTAEP